MTDRQREETRAFTVSITFRSGGETFATETYHLLAIDEFDAERLGRDRVEDSIYCDNRIPDYGIDVAVSPTEDPEPDDDPPAPAGIGKKPVCPDCGSEDIVRDAAARWDTDAQDWSLSTTYDNQTCEGCGRDGDDFAVWIPQGAEPLRPGMRVRVRPRERIGGDRFAGREGVVTRIGRFGPYVRLDLRPRERVQKTELFAYEDLDRLSGEAG